MSELDHAVVKVCGCIFGATAGFTLAATAGADAVALARLVPIALVFLALAGVCLFSDRLVRA